MKSNAKTIIAEIDAVLEEIRRKKKKISDQDLIDFIEEKWHEADDGKYKIQETYYIAGRMVTEYIDKRDFDNMMRWLDYEDLHPLSKRDPPYVDNYYRGECCLECGNEEKALEYFRLCYSEQPEYIYTRAPFCYEFFNRHLATNSAK
jgi:hypothetical protein